MNTATEPTIRVAIGLRRAAIAAVVALAACAPTAGIGAEPFMAAFADYHQWFNDTDPLPERERAMGRDSTASRKPACGS